MFNLSSATSVRHNGAVSTNSRLLGRSQRLNVTPKKASESSKSNESFNKNIKPEPYEDPYTFSDSESHFNTTKLKSLNSFSSSKKQFVSKIHNLLSNTKNIDNGSVNNAGVNASGDLKQNESWKTMNRLQAQIARNKVIVKHKKETNDVKEKPKVVGFKNNCLSDESDTKPSIIALNEELKKTVRKISPGKPSPANLKARRANLKTTHHEVLQRIRKRVKWHAPSQHGSLVDALSLSETESDDDLSIPVLSYADWIPDDNFGIDRETRITRTRSRLLRSLALYKNVHDEIPPPCQTVETITSLLESRFNNLRYKSYLSHRLPSNLTKKIPGLLKPTVCSFEEDGVKCKRNSLPCTHHCARHIMHNKDQCLYDYCTAKFADNTQCCIPVVDLNHELPLCTEHARKRDNYNRMCQVVKPKKPRKKVKPSAMIRPQKRSKKRKRPPPKSSEKEQVQALDPILHAMEHNTHDITVGETSSACDSSDDLPLNSLTENATLVSEAHFDGDDADDMVAQVLGVDEELPLELSGPEALVTDLSNVFNQIPPDAFNDLLNIDRNGVYEPTREESEELERALEAVTQDVKSLEKMSHGILGTLLDEHVLAESLAQMPDVFPSLNGFNVNTGPAQQSPVPASLDLASRSLHGIDNAISVQSSAHMS